MSQSPHISPFDAIRHEDENIGEYWSARELYKIPGYTEWRNFHNVVIKRAMKACEENGREVSEHFVRSYKMSQTGQGGQRKTEDVLNHGYKGLYTLTEDQIHARKGLRSGENISDYMGSDELVANAFRASLTRQKLEREQVKEKDKANRTHFQVGREIRNTIKRLGGTMPEDLPIPEKSIHELQREQQKLLEQGLQPSLFEEPENENIP